MVKQQSERQSEVKRYAVLGNPIAHSKSPAIHQAFAKQTELLIEYERILVPEDHFSATLNDLVAQGYAGFNVTVPFKFEAFNACHYHTPRAQMAEACNTIIVQKNGQLMGDNTDGAGLIRDIVDNLNVKLSGASILLLGAGGAAQGVLQPILEQAPAFLTVVNRNVEKAHLMVKKVAIEQAISSVNVVSYAALADNQVRQPFDIVINATSASLKDDTLVMSNQVFNEKTLAYDMMYGRETAFMSQARDCGALVADGLGMLVEQAAEAFYVWHGIRPDTRPVIQALKSDS